MLATAVGKPGPLGVNLRPWLDKDVDEANLEDGDASFRLFESGFLVEINHGCSVESLLQPQYVELY